LARIYYIDQLVFLECCPSLPSLLSHAMMMEEGKRHSFGGVDGWKMTTDAWSWTVDRGSDWTAEDLGVTSRWYSTVVGLCKSPRLNSFNSFNSFN
jgi:hypothetical protein